VRVALNLLHLVPQETGGAELYARRLIRALTAAPEAPDLVLVAGEAAASSLARESWSNSVELVALRVDSRSRVRRVLAEQTLLPRAVGRARVDLLHNVFTTAPALATVPQVTTILDVIYRRFPETHAGVLSLGMRALVPLAARRSRRILTLSEAAKADIVAYLGVPAARVDVTYLGPGLDHVTATPSTELRERLSLDHAPIVLTVSAKRPHKNLGRLIEAIAEIDREAAPVLVVPGYPTPFEDELRCRAEARAPGRVRFVGWLSDPDLAGLYGAATCFVFPSLAEGFGIPVLEALERGLPVACSRASSLPEVAGDAALYFDPLDASAIARAIEQLLDDGELRQRLADAGTRRAGRFSWSRTADATIASYERALANSRS
jgi:glycosyltransferase involved in cell wall biosynthesis